MGTAKLANTILLLYHLKSYTYLLTCMCLIDRSSDTLRRMRHEAGPASHNVSWTLLCLRRKKMSAQVEASVTGQSRGVHYGQNQRSVKRLERCKSGSKNEELDVSANKSVKGKNGNWERGNLQFLSRRCYASCPIQGTNMHGILDHDLKTYIFRSRYQFLIMVKSNWWKSDIWSFLSFLIRLARCRRFSTP